MSNTLNQHISSAQAIENLPRGEVLWFINPHSFAFIKFDRIDYSPRIKTLIRVMDTPEEDIYHHYMIQEMPDIIRVRD